MFVCNRTHGCSIKMYCVCVDQNAMHFCYKPQGDPGQGNIQDVKRSLLRSCSYQTMAMNTDIMVVACCHGKTDAEP